MKLHKHILSFFAFGISSFLYAGELFKIFQLPESSEPTIQIQYLKYLMNYMPTRGGHEHIFDPLKIISESQKLTSYLETQKAFIEEWQNHKLLKISIHQPLSVHKETIILNKVNYEFHQWSELSERLRRTGTLNRKGLSSALILQLKAELRKTAFKSLPGALIIFLEENLGSEFNENFDPTKLGLPKDISRNDLIKLLKDLTATEEMLKKAFYTFLNKSNIVEIDSNQFQETFDKFINSLKIVDLSKPFTESFLDNFTQRLATQTKTTRDKQLELILVEKAPGISAHRGRPGEDCSSKSTLASVFDPDSRVFWLYEGEENSNNLIGYVQINLGLLDGVPAIYVSSISGGGISEKATEQIFQALYKNLKFFGVEKLALPSAEATRDRVNENINNQSVRNSFYKYTRSQPNKKWTYKTPDFRNKLSQFDSLYNKGVNDSIERNSHAVEYIPNTQLLTVVDIQEIQAEIFKLPKIERSDIIKIAVDLRNHSQALESLRLRMPNYGISIEDWDNFVKIVRDHRFSNLDEFHKAIYSYMAQKWQVDGEAILPNDHIFLLYGRTRVPGAFDEPNQKLTIDLVLNDIKVSASQDLRNTKADHWHTRRYSKILQMSERYDGLLKKALAFIKSGDIQLIRNGVSLLVFLNQSDPKILDPLLELYKNAPRPVNAIIAWYLDTIQPRHEIAIQKSRQLLKSSDWEETVWGLRYFRNMRAVDSDIKDEIINALEHPHPQTRRHVVWALAPYRALSAKQENILWEKIALIGEEIEKSSTVANIKIDDRYKNDICIHVSEMINNTWNSDGSNTLFYVKKYLNTWWMQKALKFSNDSHLKNNGINGANHPFITLLLHQNCEISLL